MRNEIYLVYRWLRKPRSILRISSKSSRSNRIETSVIWSFNDKLLKSCQIKFSFRPKTIFFFLFRFRLDRMQMFLNYENFILFPSFLFAPPLAAHLRPFSMCSKALDLCWLIHAGISIFLPSKLVFMPIYVRRRSTTHKFLTQDHVS